MGSASKRAFFLYVTLFSLRNLKKKGSASDAKVPQMCPLFLKRLSVKGVLEVESKWRYVQILTTPGVVIMHPHISSLVLPIKKSLPVSKSTVHHSFQQSHFLLSCPAGIQYWKIGGLFKKKRIQDHHMFFYSLDYIRNIALHMFPITKQKNGGGLVLWNLKCYKRHVEENYIIL